MVLPRLLRGVEKERDRTLSRWSPLKKNFIGAISHGDLFRQEQKLPEIVILCTMNISG